MGSWYYPGGTEENCTYSVPSASNLLCADMLNKLTVRDRWRKLHGALSLAVFITKAGELGTIQGGANSALPSCVRTYSVIHILSLVVRQKHRRPPQVRRIMSQNIELFVLSAV